MKPLLSIFQPGRMRRGVAAGWAALALAGLPVLAGPGVHGPGGEHLDTPSTAAASGNTPRVEASSETFELVGQLYAEELSLLIDRFETNEPLLEAQVEVESGSLKAVAKFHADHGDYAVDDERLLALLRQPGAHALVFTIVKGQESDLLDATLVTQGAAAAEQAGLAWRPLLAAGGVLLLASGLLLFGRRRRAHSVPGQGGRA